MRNASDASLVALTLPGNVRVELAAAVRDLEYPDRADRFGLFHLFLAPCQ